MGPVLKVGERQVKLTNLDKILWPKPEVTKYNLINYFIDISPFLLPHLHRRPLVLQRFPDGIEGEGFYQKSCPAGSPEWIEIFPIVHQEGKTTNYIIVDSLETLIWLGNQAALELHPWLSSLDTLRHPDFAVFDLDPMEKSTFGQVKEAALVLYERLNELKLQSYVKTSGATGLQVYVPLSPVYSYETVRDFVAAVFTLVNERLPRTTTTERSIARREGKIYLDHLQNVQGKTLASCYSPRPRAGAPVSMPLFWDEVSSPGLSPGNFTVFNALERVQQVGDLFAPVLVEKQQLPGVRAGSG